MPRLSLINMLIGFATLTIAAAAGAFLSLDFTRDYLMDPGLTQKWEPVLGRSAHGHTNLFALIQICFGLTLPYSALPQRVKIWQTAGLAAGIVAMGPLLLAKSRMTPLLGLQAIDAVMGVLLTASLLTMFTHAGGIAAKVWRR